MFINGGFRSAVIFLGGVFIKAAEINEEIRDREVRLIGEENEQLGIMSAREAYMIALEKKLDLVKISPNAKPPVCKIMDYGKFRYEQQKRDKEAKKKQKSQAVRELRLGLNIEKNDLEVKAKAARKFLSDGDKVKVSLRFRGRELGYTQQGHEVFKRFSELLEDIGGVDAPPKMEGRSMVALYVPKK
ncbi:MAG: translation initiation factor IF-3 [Bacillota bacterium]|nr:translation initiation factor IF-3 [Bacillota bacterium]